MVLMAVTITIAIPPPPGLPRAPTKNAATVNRNATTTIVTRAFDGVRYRCDTFLSQADPGTPSSRLKAKSIRPAEATEERVQKDIAIDRKSTRLNSSHITISYAVFCLKKKKKK